MRRKGKMGNRGGLHASTMPQKKRMQRYEDLGERRRAKAQKQGGSHHFGWIFADGGEGGKPEVSIFPPSRLPE